MYVLIEADLSISLRDERDMRRFSIVARFEPDRLEEAQRRIGDAVRFAGPGEGWVSADFLRKWPAVSGDAEWQASFEAMVAKARPHGWIDDATGAVKAHVEWRQAAPASEGK